MIGGGVRSLDPDGQSGVGKLPLSPGGLRLSQATIASTRGSSWPTNDTALAPSEWPAIPMWCGSIMSQSGLLAVASPAATRRSCFAA